MERREFLQIGSLSIFAGGSFLNSFFKHGSSSEPFRPVLIYDPTKCIDCKSCMAACQLEKGLPAEINLFRMVEKERNGRLSFVKKDICKECVHHPCVKACPYGALYVKDGVVLIDEEKCDKECAEKHKYCLKACPYDAIVFDENIPKKCDFCFERIKNEDDVPRCVAVCPSNALIFGNLAKPTGELALLFHQKPEVEKLLYSHLEIQLDYRPSKNDLFKYAKTKKPNAKRIVNTVCLSCNARCGLRIATDGKKMIQIDGNPYHPYNRGGNEIDYNTPVEKSFEYTASTCAKPQMDNDYLYNPYRILKPLKRIGPRGSGKFKTIEWDELIKEVSEGGKLFKEIGDNDYYPGIKDVLSDELIDKNAPEFGSKRNQLAWFIGRSQSGRKQFVKRWVCEAIGSVNYISHTDICGIGFRMGNYAFSDGKQVEFKADFWNSKYMLIFGANLYSAIQPGVNTSGSILSRRMASEDLKVVLVDPRAPKAVADAYKWLAIKPTKDGDFALGILRIMLENGWYDKKFLSLPSMKAAKQMNRNVFTNSTHLVITEGKNKGKILRIKDTKLSGKPNDAVVINPLTKKPTAAENINEALLEWEGVIDGKKVKTAFKLMKESVFEHDLDFYSKECGIPKKEIFETAKEFWENAPYSVAFGYHGGGNYMGGTYASLAYALLNAMVGNVNKKGGYLNKGKGVAKWEEGLYDLKNFPGKHKAKGVKISREKAKYEESTEFKKHGYPSKLPWFEFTKGGLSMSAISGIDQKYPYPIKVLITYFSDFVYSMPGGIRFAQTLKDKDKVPLFISIDHTINETNIYADYIVPDVTYLEGQYGFLTPHAPGGWFTGVRTPVFEPLTGKTKDGRHFNMEEFLIDVAKYLKLPGYGDNAIRGKDSKTYPLNRAEDYYLRAISNLAHNAKVKEADDNEIKEVEENYPVAKFKNILSKKEWKKVCYVLARGGIFKKEKEVFDKHGNFKFGIPHICIWNEKMATSKNTLSGKTFWGTVKHQVSTDYFGESIDKLDKDFKFNVITYKSALQTQSRSICHRQALVYEPDFTLKINPKDAVKLNLKDGDTVRVYSKSNKEGLITKVKITDLVGEGSVAYSYHFGHWQHGASSFYVEGAKEAFLGKNIIKGNTVKADKKRAVGILTNKLSRLDERMYNLPLVDPLGGIPDFSSTKVNIEKI